MSGDEESEGEDESRRKDGRIAGDVAHTAGCCLLEAAASTALLGGLLAVPA